MIVNIHAAKTNLSKLIERAEAGEEVIIARAGRPVAKLSPLREVRTTGMRETASAPTPSWIGSMRGQIKLTPGWDEPDEELIRLMEDGPIFPTDEPGD